MEKDAKQRLLQIIKGLKSQSEEIRAKQILLEISINKLNNQFIFIEDNIENLDCWNAKEIQETLENVDD